MTSNGNEKPLVLLVDDDREIRDIVALLLPGDRYRVETAADGGQALARLAKGELPHLILLDLMMPRVDGWQFLGERERQPALAAIPVVVLSGMGDIPEAAGLTNVAGWLRKPFDLESLVEQVEKNI